MLNKNERKKDILNKISNSKNKDFDVKGISYKTPLDAIKNTAPNILKNNKHT